MATPSSNRPSRPTGGDAHIARARQVIAIEIAGLRALSDQVDQAFAQAVEVLLACLQRRAKVVVVGIGKSGIIARKMAATFSSTGTPAVLLHSVDALHGDLGIVHDGDVVLALSYSGETDELLHLLPALKRLAHTLIAFTGAPRSTLARHSDVVLNTRVPREACPLDLAPTASTTAMLALGDALALAVMQARDFTPAQFARYHPAGALGRALLLKVSDVMRTGPRNPVCPTSATVRDALLVMTRAKAGCVSVVHPSGRLAGVFTDGDLRRHLAAGEEVMQRPIQQVMTRRPVTLPDTALAADALRVFNQWQIDDLVVVNARREPVGVVDLQDLPRHKVV